MRGLSRPAGPVAGAEPEDDEIVSFEAFCGGSGADPGPAGELGLNDNINYRLYYGGAAGPGGAEPALEKETSLDARPAGKRRASFLPFGRGVTGRSPERGAGGACGDGADSEPGYRRFSEEGGRRAVCGRLPGLGSGALVLGVVCVLSVAVWWAVYGAIGDAWSEEHYRKLWERAHPDKAHQAHYFPSVLVHQEPDAVPVVPNFHDHNNLSTKNRANATENSRKKESRKTAEPRLEDNLCSNVKDDFRFDCYPEPGANEAGCLKRGCCWMEKERDRAASQSYRRKVPEKISLPYCFYPPQYGTYKFANMTENKHGMIVYYEKKRSSAYPDNFNVVKMEFKYISDDSLQIKISDAENRRFEPPVPEIPMVSSSISNLQYQVIVEGPKTGFKLLRVSDNVTILNTQNAGGLILSDKLLQLSALLPTHTLYGLGERRGAFQLSTDWQQHTLFNFDTVPRENTNLYGTHPFYLAMEESGKSHGVLLLNSNAMDIILQPAPAITYRTIGGVLNLFVFLGPKPSDVVSQYTELIGLPFMPPYWSLGFHLCKFNYGSLNVTKEVWNRTREAGIPFDVQWNDLDYMNNSNDFTYDEESFEGLPEFVEHLHSVGMHWIPLIDPGVSASEPRGLYPPYDRGIDMDLFVKDSKMKPFVGKVWNKKSTVWPDFSHPNATPYWLEMLKMFHDEVHFDGVWIDMNEPSNFLSGPYRGSCLPENMTYVPHVSGADGLRSKTMCMENVHYAGRHYDIHNLYALTEAIVTNFALTEIRGKRPFIISRSSFVGLGQYAGHWSGDVASEWHDMQMSIPELLSFSLFGVPMMGADICGFSGNTTVELCTRWMQLGAFYPFSRNHNSDQSIPQDPVALGPQVVAASRASLRLRYALLPYLYTLFWKAHVNGETVARPLFFEFPLDKVTYTIDQQFLLGPAIMIVPILTPGATMVRGYLPRQIWYRLSGMAVVPSSGWVPLTENQTVLVKGGSVVALQTPPAQGPVSTHVARSGPLQLLVAPCDMRRGHGELYWDAGDTLNTLEEKTYSYIKFSHSGNSLRSRVILWGYGVPSVDKIIIMNQEKAVTKVTLDQKQAMFTYDSGNKLLTVYKLTLSLNHPFVLSWQ